MSYALHADDIRLQAIGLSDLEQFDCIILGDFHADFQGERLKAYLHDITRMTDQVILLPHGVDQSILADEAFPAFLQQCGFVLSGEEHPVTAGLQVYTRGDARPAEPRDKSAAEYRARTEKFQRDVSAGHVEMYWQAYNQTRFFDICAVVRELFEPVLKPEALADAPAISVFDFGCSAGPLFRALQEYLGGQYRFEFAGADVDADAIRFVRRALKGILAFEADPARLASLEFARAEQFDVCVATSLFYALGDIEAELLLGEMARMSDTLIIGDQIENLDGEASVVLSLISVDNVAYDAVCHPFRTMLRRLGFEHFEVIKAAQPVKSRTGMLVARRSTGFPSTFAQHVTERARTRYFGKMESGVPRVPTFPLRFRFDAGDSQLERLVLPKQSKQGAIFTGPELIGTFGVKLSTEIQPFGWAMIEVMEEGRRSTSPVVFWDRPPLEIPYGPFEDRNVLPRQTTYAHMPPDLWGGWADLKATADGTMLCVLDEKTDIDANQADGIGPLDLLFYTFPKADLRDATFELEIRGIDFEPGESEIYILLQNSIPAHQVGGALEAAILGRRSVSADYVLTSQPLTAHLKAGGWQRLKLHLANDPAQWSFAGNVLADGPESIRYSYVDLDRTLGDVVNIHILACYPKGVPNYENKRDPSPYGKRARGKIELRSAALKRAPLTNEKRFLSFDYITTSEARRGQYRVHQVDSKGQYAVAPWQTFECPSTSAPVAHWLAYDHRIGEIRGRINSMGYRTWCWLEKGKTCSEQLYLGTTRHGRDFAYRLVPDLSQWERFVVANEYGLAVFEIADLPRCGVV